MSDQWGPPQYPTTPPAVPTWPAPPPAPPDMPLQPITTGGNGGGRRAAIAVVAVVALVAGVFALSSVRSGGKSGASSSGEAVEEFFAALGNEDVIGMLEMVDPGERALFRPALERLRDELQRLGIITSVDLGHVPGLDLTVDGLEVESVELLPGIEEVTVTAGTITVESIPDEIPLGEVMENLIEAAGGEVEFPEVNEEFPLPADNEDDEFFITTETDGRWHLSLFFSIAEDERRRAGYDLPDPAAAIAAAGAESPEDAVRQLVDAAVTLDLRRMIELLPPDEARALQLYAPLFLEEAQQDADDSLAESEVEITVDELELDTTAVDGGSRVTPVGGRVTVSTPDGDVTVAIDDAGCVTVEADDEVIEEFSDFYDIDEDGTICPGETVAPTAGIPDDEAFSDDPIYDEFTDLFSDAAGVAERLSEFKLGVVVVERGGQFFVDPLRTGADFILQILGLLDRRDFEEGGAIYEVVTGFSEFIEEIGD